MTIEEAEKAVEEARFRLAGELVVAPGSPAYWEALDALIEAVRQAERERAEVLFLASEDGLGALAAMLFIENPPRDLALKTMHRLQEVLIPWQAARSERARSSEEAGNGSSVS